MRRGLVIGKFLPIHKGHIALIEFAAQHCDELIVSMSYTTNDPIDPQIRFYWIKEIFRNSPSIKPALILDDFDVPSLDWSERTKIWARKMQETYPAIDVLFSSEEYGKPFAENLGVEHVIFDPARKIIPVSASLIRENALKYWDCIPDVVRPFFVKKICFYGSESTGKSVMAERMAQRYQTEFVPEVARELITSNDFNIDDIIRIGYAQYERVQQKLKTANKFLFCDTDAITTQIYSQKYLGVIPPVLFELEEKVTYDLYFLFDVDVPWVADGLRDLGHERVEMSKVFQEELDKRNIPFCLVQGDYAQREQIIVSTLNKLLDS